MLFICIRYVEIAKLLIQNGSKIDYREPTNELYPRTMLCDEPLRLALKNRNYVSARPTFKFVTNKSQQFIHKLLTSGDGKIAFGERR